MNTKSIRKQLTGLSLIICHLSFSLALASCSDFFEPNPKNIISEDDAFDTEEEMYKGMLGIFNRMQEAGDQAIWLTDTRCNFLETTANAPDALKSIYNYEPTQGNEYADPTCYYAIVIACNDYIQNMAKYHHNVGGLSETAQANFEGLLASALRIKVWAYLTLGRIYGQAYWFDSSLTEKADLTDTSVFTHCNMQQLVEKCLTLLEQGIDVDGKHIDAAKVMEWYTWLDETSNEDAYAKWQYLTPPYLLLHSELLSWRCCYLDEAAAQPYWQTVRDDLLSYMNGVQTGAIKVTSIDNSAETADYLGFTYQCNVPLSTGDMGQNYISIFSSTSDVGNKYQFVCGIMYDYANHQRNRIVQYLCPTYPDADAFFLQPSQYGLKSHNPDDIRSLEQGMVLNTLGGKPAVTKYYYFYNTESTVRNYQYKSDNIFDIEPTVIIYRGHDFHFLLAEAEAHLGNFLRANIILNMGMENYIADREKAQSGEGLPADWPKGYASWFGRSGGYGNNGIVGAARGTVHQLPTSAAEAGISEDRLKQMYDWALADEYLKEYVAEGKSYSYLCKMGERWSQAGRGSLTEARDSVVSRIAPKYTSAAAQAKVRAYIAANGYFIQWDLKDAKQAVGSVKN